VTRTLVIARVQIGLCFYEQHWNVIFVYMPVYLVLLDVFTCMNGLQVFLSLPAL
jgi:hypothetical protein